VFVSCSEEVLEIEFEENEVEIIGWVQVFGRRFDM
jgi:hypothetical protein